ncbi:MAG TPA: DUF4982 domain-containing protein, partial [Saprospiraceae bacterium]|nr:DUF4982 domain-containing protein [Saprospiraceae bacterium]
GDCAELFLNGKSLGVKCKKPDSQKSIERFRLIWNEVIYQPGELKAVAYKENEIIGQEIIKTAGNPFQIRLTADRETIKRGETDLSYILIEALDRNGLLCPLADNLIQIEISGDGNIAGIGNGNPQSMESFQSDHVKLFYGKAMLIIKSGSQSGMIHVEALSKGLQRNSVTVNVR